MTELPALGLSLCLAEGEHAKLLLAYLPSPSLTGWGVCGPQGLAQDTLGPKPTRLVAWHEIEEISGSLPGTEKVSLCYLQVPDHLIRDFLPTTKELCLLDS